MLNISMMVIIGVLFFSHSVDLLKGKEPFVEIFLEYGFFTRFD